MSNEKVISLFITGIIFSEYITNEHISEHTTISIRKVHPGGTPNLY